MGKPIKFGDSKEVVAELHMDRVHFNWMINMLDMSDNFKSDSMAKEWRKVQAVLDGQGADMRFN